MIEQGQTVAANLNSLSQGVATEFQNQYANLTGIVTQVNDAVAKVADLNQQIMQGQAGGNNINALIDQRDAAVTQVVKLAGARADNLDDGTVQVTVGGVTLVSGNAYTPMTISGASTIQDVTDSPLSLKVGGVTATPSGARRPACSPR